MRLFSLVLAFSLLATGCGVRAGIKRGSKSLGRFSVGEEERHEVSCVEGSGEEVYVWVRVGGDSSAYDSEKRVWDFIGKRKSDDKVLRVINNSCRMVIELLI